MTVAVRRRRLSAAEARRVALAAQGFADPRPTRRVDVRHYRKTLDAIRVLQLDYVNVLMPAHFLVLWSRLGAYDKTRFERFLYAGGAYTEQWAHEASIVPSACWPLLAHRREEHQLHKQNPLMRLRHRRAYLDAVLEQVRQQGPVTARDLPPLPGPKKRPGDWHRSLPRRALDYHFGRGGLAVVSRRPNFQRVYDLPDRVLPAQHLARSIERADAERELLKFAAFSLGVGTVRDLADYYRMSPKDAAPRLLELVEERVISPVDVEGWKETAYLAKTARFPRKIHGASLISPFDPLLWFRPRAGRLFGFHYRIEIYVPAAQRKWGYYVLPFRVGDDIVARVDLKADRQAGKLRVLAAHAEPLTNRRESSAELVRELLALKDWLELDTIEVTRHNPYSRLLATSL